MKLSQATLSLSLSMVRFIFYYIILVIKVQFKGRVRSKKFLIRNFFFPLDKFLSSSLYITKAEIRKNCRVLYRIYFFFLKICSKLF